MAVWLKCAWHWAQRSGICSITAWVHRMVEEALGDSLVCCWQSLRCADGFQQPSSLTVHAPTCLFSSPWSTWLDVFLTSPPHLWPLGVLSRPCWCLLHPCSHMQCILFGQWQHCHQGSTWMCAGPCTVSGGLSGGLLGGPIKHIILNPKCV